MKLNTLTFLFGYSSFQWELNSSHVLVPLDSFPKRIAKHNYLVLHKLVSVYTGLGNSVLCTIVTHRHYGEGSL